jgi:hypothetical protein
MVHLPYALAGRAADHLADEPKVCRCQLGHPPGQRATRMGINAVPLTGVTAIDFVPSRSLIEPS